MTRDNVIEAVYDETKFKNIKIKMIKEAKRVRTMKHLAEFCSKYSYYFMFDTPISTLKNRSLEMRKALIAGGIDEDSPIIEFFKLPSPIFTAMHKKEDEIVLSNLENAKEDNTNYAVLSDKIISKLTNMLENDKVINESNNSNSERDKAYAELMLLAVATGRRQIELLKLLEISKKKNEAEYKNLAKKKESDKDSIVAPILIDVHIAKKYLKHIREVFKTEDMTNKQVNSKYNGSISKAIQRYLSEFNIKSFHEFRKIYAEACYEKFGKSEDKNMYFQEILGHEIRLNAAHNYQAKK